MRKKQLKEMHDRASAYNELNNVIIESIMERLKEPDLTDEKRIESVELLEEQLKCRGNFEDIEKAYRERKAEDKGYWIGVGGSLLGVFIAEVGPRIIKVLKKK